MKTVRVERLKEGDILAKPIMDAFGRVLLQKDVIFTRRIIQRLADFNFKYVYIHDPLTDDLYPNELLDDQLRLETVQHLRESFKLLNQLNAGDQQVYVVEKKFSHIQRKIKEINQLINENDEMLSIMSDMFLFDDYVYMHSLNVTVYTLALANELGFSTTQIEEIGIGAMLHDIGKTRVPKSILNKPDKLTDLEFDTIKEHTTYGYDLLKTASFLSEEIKYCVLQHHERLDGSGYPYGLTEQNIHPYAQILSVTDVFDATTSNRVYRSGLLPHEGLEILYSGSGKLFKQEYIELFRKQISIYPNGTYVTLSSGEKGFVAKQNKHVPDRPCVRVIATEERKLQSHEVYEIDLSKRVDVIVTACTIGDT